MKIELKDNFDNKELEYSLYIKCECGTELFVEVETIDTELREIRLKSERCEGCYYDALDYMNTFERLTYKLSEGLKKLALTKETKRSV